MSRSSIRSLDPVICENGVKFRLFVAHEVEKLGSQLLSALACGRRRQRRRRNGHVLRQRVTKSRHRRQIQRPRSPRSPRRPRRLIEVRARLPRLPGRPRTRGLKASSLSPLPQQCWSKWTTQWINQAMFLESFLNFWAFVLVFVLIGKVLKSSKNLA